MSKHTQILRSMIAARTWQPLSGAAQAVLTIMLLRADSALSVSLSAGDFVKQTGKSKATVWRALVELQESGLVKKTATRKINSEANSYRVIAPAAERVNTLAG